MISNILTSDRLKNYIIPEILISKAYGLPEYATMPSCLRNPLPLITDI